MCRSYLPSKYHLKVDCTLEVSVLASIRNDQRRNSVFRLHYLLDGLSVYRWLHIFMSTEHAAMSMYVDAFVAVWLHL